MLAQPCVKAWVPSLNDIKKKNIGVEKKEMKRYLLGDGVDSRLTNIHTINFFTMEI